MSQSLLSDAESNDDRDFHEAERQERQTDEGRSDVTHVIGSSELTVSIFAAVNLHPHHSGLVNDVLNVVTVLADYLRCNSKDVIW